MENQKLTYDEWRKRYSIEITEAARTELLELHDIDADLEIDSVMRQEYERYINGEYNRA
jgi:hypothetical protein